MKLILSAAVMAFFSTSLATHFAHMDGSVQQGLYERDAYADAGLYARDAYAETDADADADAYYAGMHDAFMVRRWLEKRGSHKVPSSGKLAVKLDGGQVCNIQGKPGSTITTHGVSILDFASFSVFPRGLPLLTGAPDIRVSHVLVATGCSRLARPTSRRRTLISAMSVAVRVAGGARVGVGERRRPKREAGAAAAAPALNMSIGLGLYRRVDSRKGGKNHPLKAEVGGWMVFVIKMIR